MIEHLHIKLYQNKPANVLAELVANSWGAGAKNVWIDICEGTADLPARICVMDDGSRMDAPAIRTRYLVIGLNKQAASNQKGRGSRLPMGRKGIGKLAPFGIARAVDVATIASKRLNWFTLELDAKGCFYFSGIKPHHIKSLNVISAPSSESQSQVLRSC